jgi:hypothetical protein
MAAFAALSLPGAGVAQATQTGRAPAKVHSLYQSRLLWATVNVCNAIDQPNTIGIRGSMPGDGNPQDTMYMRFRVQYLDPVSGQWLYLVKGADSGYLPVGSANYAARQAGRSFQFVPTAGKSPFKLRGAVSFQWRSGKRIVHSASRPTTAGHHSLAGADPPRFTAATCVI